MKLSKIYSNLPQYFKAIRFNEGFNVIIGKVSDIQNEKKNSHNLGKTLLIDIIDYCLLKNISSDHFTNHLPDDLNDLEFYLEVILLEKKFLTIRRPLKKNTKISFKESDEGDLDFSNTPSDHWDQFELPINDSKEFLDGKLNLSSIRPFQYRKGISYFLRKQKDYSDVFQVEKFSRGEHSAWKPYVGKILGLNESIIEKNIPTTRKLQ